jgi:hypothetical protein
MKKRNCLSTFNVELDERVIRLLRGRRVVKMFRLFDVRCTTAYANRAALSAAAEQAT